MRHELLFFYHKQESLDQQSSNFIMHQNHPARSLYIILGIDLERLCISKKFPGDTDASCLGTTLKITALS